MNRSEILNTNYNKILIKMDEDSVLWKVMIQSNAKIFEISKSEDLVNPSFSEIYKSRNFSGVGLLTYSNFCSQGDLK